MSTNSNIGIRYENGQIDSIYCHWDGGFDHNGQILAESYNDVEKARELIELGDISSLGNHIAADDPSKHTFDSPEQGVTVAYHRDRGEPLCVSRDCCEDEFKDSEYSYLFDVVKNRWFFSYEGCPFINLVSCANYLETCK